MSHVVPSLDQPSTYKDSQARVDRQKQNELLAKSTTLYVSATSEDLILLLGLTKALDIMHTDRQPELFHDRRTDIRALLEMRLSGGRWRD
jgi:hypothetical protein